MTTTKNVNIFKNQVFRKIIFVLAKSIIIFQALLPFFFFFSTLFFFSNFHVITLSPTQEDLLSHRRNALPRHHHLLRRRFQCADHVVRRKRTRLEWDGNSNHDKKGSLCHENLHKNSGRFTRRFRLFGVVARCLCEFRCIFESPARLRIPWNVLVRNRSHIHLRSRETTLELVETGTIFRIFVPRILRGLHRRILFHPSRVTWIL